MRRLTLAGIMAVAVIGTATAAVLFAVLVWPTRYRYEDFGRIDRLTGEMSVLRRNASGRELWFHVPTEAEEAAGQAAEQAANAARPRLQDIPNEVRARISVEGGLVGVPHGKRDYFQHRYDELMETPRRMALTVSNRSDWIIESVLISVEIESATGKMRTIRELGASDLLGAGSVGPLRPGQARTFDVDIEPAATGGWSIANMTGVPPGKRSGS